MWYPSIEKYLNEEFRIPIKEAMEEGNFKEAMEFVDYLCDKYREMNFSIKYYEDKNMIDESKFKIRDFMAYIAKKAPPVDYDKLDSNIESSEVS